MVITHDDDWSSISEGSTSQYNPHDLVENVLAFRDIYEENGGIVHNVTFMNYPNFYYLRKMLFSYSRRENL